MSGTSPTDHGYAWIAEWEKHEATWISWPHNELTWPGRFHTIPSVTEELVRTISQVETVHVLGGPTPSFDLARSSLQGISNVVVHNIPTNDVWIRDYGPTFVIDKKRKRLGAVRWRFNAWGNKYPHYQDDARAAKTICDGLDPKGHWCQAQDAPLQHESLDSFPSTMVCEGGALETDGEGTLLTTSSAVYTGTRNPNWSREQIENEFKKMLGVRKVLWVDGGELAGDDTDSHIDQLVRFARPGVVFAALSSSPDDSNARHLQTQFEALRRMTDAAGRSLEIIPLMTPPPRLIQGKRVPESYCNYYLANGIVVVPQFGHRPTDVAAVGILKEHFSDRQVIPIDASDFVWGLGAFHCATQQQPAV